MLVGRASECQRIARLIDEARRGRSGALVLRGEAGIGKTALLEHAAAEADGMVVVRVRALESEQDIPFVGLLEGCRSLLGALDAIPAWQAEALRGALALGPPRAPERLVVGAATLSLIAAGAETCPLLLLVDDAQWLDPASAEAFLFAARRLEVDPVAVLFAARDGEQRFEAPEIAELTVDGLNLEESLELLASSRAAECAPDVAVRIADVTGGNPLALLELPELLSEAQLGGTEPFDDPVRVGARVERAFERRVAALGEPARRLLLVAAAAGGDLESILVALDRMMLDRAVLHVAEDAGLVSLDSDDLRFMHPLVRSSVYHGAAPSERRAAHLALAAAWAGRDEGRRAWHLSAAALGHDEPTAALLEETGHQTAQRGGYASAAAALERAARLGEAGQSRVRRLLAAADASWLSGAADRAAALAREGLATGAEGPLRAELIALRGQIEAHVGDQQRAYAAFVEAADQAEPDNPSRAAAFLVEAVFAATHLSLTQMEKVEERLGAVGDVDKPLVRLLVGLAHTNAESMAGRGEPHAWKAEVDAAIDRVSGSSASPLELYWAGRARLTFGENSEASALASRAMVRLQDGQGVGLLVELLRLRASADADRGAWRSAYASAAEAVDLAEALGLAQTRCACLALLAELDAAAGNSAACRRHADSAIAIAIENGLAFYRERAERALARLDFLNGDLLAAAERFEGSIRRLHEAGNRELNVTSVPDLVEVFVRLGDDEQAQQALAQLRPRADGLTPHEEALLRRSRGLVAVEDEYRAELDAALELHSLESFPFERARTELVLGERLRRSGERRAAREWLGKARATFHDLGADAWTRRADDELHASGSRRREPNPATRDHLTPRESQIAQQVAEGRSNQEVAAALYLTPKTVEFHLTRIYRKLGIRSRAQLARALGASLSRDRHP